MQIDNYNKIQGKYIIAKEKYYGENGNKTALKQVKFDESKETMFLITSSHNEEYNPVVVNGNSDELTLVGKVAACIRLYK